MNKLSTEEKAKAYDEALGRAKEMRTTLSDKAISEYIFPELKESEDERIRKELHIYLDWLDGRKDYAPRGKYTIREMIAWLEKQALKSECGKEDEHRVEDIIYFLDTAKKHYASIVELDACINWLKSIKERLGG